MWTVDTALEFIRNSVSEISPTQNQNLVLSLMRYFTSQLKDMYKQDGYEAYTDIKNRVQVLEGKFLFSLVWALGGSATTESRKAIDAFLKKLLSGDIKVPEFEKRKLTMPERGSLFDYNFVPKKGAAPGSTFEWVNWVDFIDVNEKIPNKIQPQEIIVKTNDTVRYSFLLGLNIANEIPTLFCGPAGTGKSCYIKDYINTKLPVTEYMSI